jgi:very-short-patch-repair endonuclease
LILSVMGRPALVPEVLRRGPFTLDEARRAGLTAKQLRGKRWRRVGPSTYVWARLAETPLLKLKAARLRLPAAAAFSGLTAAWLHGIDVEPCDPIEVTVPGECRLAGIHVRRASLAGGDVTTVRGMPATSAVRTLGETCGRLRLVEAVVLLDMALHGRLVRLAQLSEWADAHGGHSGIKNFRQALALAEPAAESPMETRLRMALVLARLPRPRAQVAIHDPRGQFAGRVDLYYEQRRLAIEYDGSGHRDSLADDNRRQNRLLSTGIRLLRFTASDVLNHPESVVAQVRREIGTVGTSRTMREPFTGPSGTKRTKFQIKTIAS